MSYVIQNNDPSHPVGTIDIDWDRVDLGELPENTALVPAYNTETGEVLHWALVPIVNVQTERTGATLRDAAAGPIS